MIKKLLILILALLPMMAKAQQAVGSWTFYPSFSTVQKIVETKQKVYYISAGSLFYFDKETEERGHLNSSTGLNDVEISNIFFNPNGNYLLVCYTTGNMDKIYDSGRIVNLPDIANAIMTTAPSVKDVAFGKDAFYVLTNFGLVNYDDNKNEVRATAYTDQIQSVMCMGDYVVANIDNQLRFAPLTERVTNIDKLKLLPNYTNRITKPKMLGTPEGLGYFADGPASGYKVWKMTVDFASGTPSFALITDPATGQAATGITDIVANADGTINLMSKGAIFRLDLEGKPTRITIPTTLQGQVISSSAGASSVWTANNEGIAEFDLTASDPVTLRDRFTGSELTVLDPKYLTPAPDGKIIPASRYMDRLYDHGLHPQTFRFNIIDHGKILDITPVPNTISGNIDKSYRIVQSPNDPNLYFVGVWRGGVYRIDNGEYTDRYSTSNAPFLNDRIVEVFFDKPGNLWVICDDYNCVYLLPADKIAKGAGNVTKEDWVHTQITTHHGRDTRGYGCTKSNLVLMCKVYGDPKPIALTIYDTKGTATPDDDEFISIETIYDQDNNSVNTSFAGFAEDNEGNIFVGSDGCVLNLGKPKVSQLGTTATFNRIKIPRNDGTNLADYLADGSQIYEIAVDAANNKWLATSSGAIQVNSTNDKIIQHFTADNSPLPANRVQAVACDPNSNSVWFAFANGLMEYSSNTSPGSDDFSEVYAYPNPVRPEYSGWITIKGLMNDSLVKIADAAGNVVNQGRSNGGMYLWDGCNPNGERVRSGVYYVYASQNATGSSSGAVTKILVVN